MATIVHRQALAPRPVNDSTPQRLSGSAGPGSSHSLKRAREDDGEDVVASRGSAKRSRASLDNISDTLRAIAPETKIAALELTPRPMKPAHTVAKVDKQADRTTEDKLTKGNRTSSKKTREEKEKSHAARLAAEEEFSSKYRSAFPSWKFYFDGVPTAAVATATKRIESLGAVVSTVLSKEVTHFIIPTKLEKENGKSQKSLVVPKTTTTLRSPFELKISPDAVEKAKQWGLKMWDIAKLESVLDRTLARPSKSEPTTTTTAATHTASQKLALASVVPKNPYGTLGVSKAPKAQGHGGTWHLPPPSKRPNAASASLASLLATEKATNMTLERDPNSRRHDYTYFNKLAAFLIVDSTNIDYQGVGRLEFEASKPTVTLPLKLSFGGPGVNENRSAFVAAHKGQNGHLDYPILYMDHRMRCPFQPYNQRVEQKERRADARDKAYVEDRQQIIRYVRAYKRHNESLNRTVDLQQLVSEAIAALSPATGETPSKANVTAKLDGHAPASTNPDKDRASGFMRSTANQESLASMASVTSLSAATGVPTTMSHPTTGYSFSQSGGSWTKHVGAGGIVPNFSGVRHATQVVMNRGAFAAEAAPEAPVLIARTKTADDLTVKAARTGGDPTSIRRTKSLATIQKTKESQPVPTKEAEKKQLGLCECCKEQYESLAEHVQSHRHRKYACDPRRWGEVDAMAKKLRRYRKSDWEGINQYRENLRLQIFAAHGRPLDGNDATPGEMFTRSIPHPFISRRVISHSRLAKSISIAEAVALDSTPATGKARYPSSAMKTPIKPIQIHGCEVIDLTISTSTAAVAAPSDLGTSTNNATTDGMTEPGTIETMALTTTATTTTSAASSTPSEIVTEVVFERPYGRAVRKQATPLPDRKWTERDLPSVGSDTPLVALAARGGWTSELEDDEDRRVVLE